MTYKDRPRLIVTAGIFVLFGYVLWHNPENEMLIGALIGTIGTAVTFWLGSSKGSADKSSQIEHITEQASGRPDDPLNVKPVEGEQ